MLSPSVCRFLAGVSAAAALQFSAAAAEAAGLPPAIHAYGLNKTYADELGGPAIVPHGGKLGKTSYAFDRGQGVTLRAAVPGETYSVELLFTPQETSSYRRIIDFSIGNADLGLYIHYGYAYFYNLAGGNDLVFADGQPANVLITRNGATKVVKVYVNGAFQFSFTDSTGAAVFQSDALGTSATFLMDDFDYAGEHTAGSLDHLRVFDKVLTAADAKRLANGKLPPNVKTR